MKSFLIKIAFGALGVLCFGLTQPAVAHEEKTRITLDTPGLVMFHLPVAVESVLVTSKTGQLSLKATNGVTIEVPHMATVWNGDTAMFNQTPNEPGDKVIMHLRRGEPYRVMGYDEHKKALIIGSYDGVFYIPEEFIASVDIDGLDYDIYADAHDSTESAYDQDLGDPVVSMDADEDVMVVR